MIIYSINGLKTYETQSGKPNEDWTGNADYVIDETDPSKAELVSKIMACVPYFDYVVDSNGNLTDVTKTGELPAVEPSKSPIETLQDENKELQAKVKALTESNQMLEDCIVEMAEIVYA